MSKEHSLSMREANNRHFEAVASGEKPKTTYKPAHSSSKKELDERRAKLELAKIEAEHE